MTVEEQEGTTAEEFPTKGLVVGIIYPPPEVRNVVDKTAAFVAKNGSAFEEKIRQNEINNPKFKFLDSSDPFHNYYQHRIKEILKGNVTSEPTAPSQPALTSTNQKSTQDQFKIPDKIVLKDPPPEPEFILDPPSISGYDLDVVKLTAQFVARNGRQFLNNLMNRESRNFEFDFLRPQHNLFRYFTKLVEHYGKILLPPKELLPKLKEQHEDPDYYMNDTKYRVAWTKQQNLHKKREEDEREREKIAYAQVNWHAFKIVGHVDPFDSLDLPPMIRPEHVGSRLLEEERHKTISESVATQNLNDIEMKEVVENDRSQEADTSVQDMDEDSESDEEDNQQQANLIVPPLPTGALVAVNTDNVIIRRDYNPKAARPVEVLDSEVYFTCPLTNEKVPADKYNEHMRINLLDPKWTEQRDRSLKDKKEEMEIYADGSTISKNLKYLADKRSDIFGLFNEETEIGKTIGEETKKPNPKAIWDGHSSSSEKVSQLARQSFTIEDQIADIHKHKGLAYDEEKQKIGPAITPQTHLSQPNHSTQPSQVLKAPPTLATRPTVVPAQPLLRPMVPGLTPGAMNVMPQMSMLMGQSATLPQVPLTRPPFMPPVGLLPGLAPMMPVMHAPMPGFEEDEPLHKRAKLEDALIPEHEFLARNPNLVEFKVQLPMIDKSEWKLNGQAFPVTLPLSDSVSVIKAKIFDEVGMPAGKQKLQLDGMFLKDSNTLAYYNINPNSVVVLQLKERGGRKK